MSYGIKKVLFVLMGVVLFIFLMGPGDWVYAKGGSRDKDKDGLTNRQEKLLGTNPRDADTDNDGMMDGVEVDIGTDPLNSDSDDDGLDDGSEILDGTDPDDSDSDDDGVEDPDDDENNPIEAKELETSLVPYASSTLTFKKGEVKIEGESQTKVKVKVHIVDMQDADGNLFTGDITLVIEGALDGTPLTPPLEIPFTITDGTGWTREIFDLTGESLSISSICLNDSIGNCFAGPGIIIGGDDDNGGDDDGDDDDGDDDDDNGNDNQNNNENSNENANENGNSND